MVITPSSKGDWLRVFWAANLKRIRGAILAALKAMV
jgi:hypothetical protein